MDTTTCSYASPIAPKKGQGQADASPDDMRNRIDRLESLVLLLMHGGPNTDAAAAGSGVSGSHSTADSGSVNNVLMGRDGKSQMVEDEEDEEHDSEDELAADMGLLKVDPFDQRKSMYFGRTHWHTILADITEIKDYFAHHMREVKVNYEHVKSSKPNVECDGPTLFLGAASATEVELRAQLPSKSVIIKLCSRFFNSIDDFVSIIHGPSFFNQLKKHWEDPTKTSTMWLAMLYGMLCLAMFNYHKTGDEPPEWKGQVLELAAEYRMRTVQCLIKADYTKPSEYTVEAMMLYLFGEYFSRWDSDTGIWLIVSLTTRIAFRMGYHRDAKWFPSLTPFQAEMRRRSWAMLRMTDIVTSQQLSLPSMIHELDCDAQIPNNYFDEDFHPDCKELPPPRPLTEPTPISYMILKSKLCFELGNILQAINRSGKGIPYEEVIRFDAKLRQIISETPPHLRLQKWEDSHDPVTLIVARYKADIFYQKIMCLLHRKYMVRARQNPRYALSRKRAIESSMQALCHLAKLHRESQSGRRLSSIAWFVKAIATKEFLQPAMLISLELHYDNVSRQTVPAPPTHEGNFLWSTEQRDKMMDSLDSAQKIWAGLAHTSMEAFKGAKIVEIMLKKIRDPDPSGEMPPAGSLPDWTESSSSDPDTGSRMPSTGLLNSPAVAGYDPLNLQFTPPPINAFSELDFSMPIVSDFAPEMDSIVRGPEMPPSMGLFQNMGNLPAQGDLIANFDWGAFENYTQMAPWGGEQNFNIYNPPERPTGHGYDAGMMNGQ
ncbi:putative transcriptional regulatory protein [Escovopsis weberi]|uniref:Putative transcriptional regulatory protein n=1 Tax=Escovopsis weberi TaxID=150374 RepID=A0A0M8N699_ESCWE|nr:putative transcriptional regulatory protein [Escovopsis weberi]